MESLGEYDLELGKRTKKGVFFYRINGYNPKIHEFIRRYYEAARLCGVIIEGRLQNPTSDNLSYYAEMMGTRFELSKEFISASLQKWLPRMNALQRDNVSSSIFYTLNGLKQAGKTDSILKNIYVKFMCWLYYKFERIVNHLGEEKLPKILYEGQISNHELFLMSVLCEAGCDIVLLQYHGDASYKLLDPKSERSDNLQLPNMQPFPESFHLKQIQKELSDLVKCQQVYGGAPKLHVCTNTWADEDLLESLRIAPKLRGSKFHGASESNEEKNNFYNCFLRVWGAEDKLTYENELYQLQLQLRNGQRNLVIVSQKIEVPTPEEISNISRKTYQNVDQLIADLIKNIDYASNTDLQQLMKQAFSDVMREKAKAESMVSRLTNSAVYLLCWMKRFQYQLFPNWKAPQVSCFFYLGGCQNANEALFCSLLARLPVDVVIFVPDLNRGCCLTDSELVEIKNEFSMTLSNYPQVTGELRVGTVAYQAERELDTFLYRGTGIYRSQQYAKANIIPLHTSYEEISILWDNEVKYRPNFSTIDGVVNIPVLFAKISGVKNGNISDYWSSIKKLITSDAVVIKKVPQLTPTDENPIKPYAVEFFKNGRIQKQKILQHKAYAYGFLREAVQEHLLDKLQQLIQQRTIAGTMENGTEYTIVSVALNMDKKLLQLIQNFDFTKKNPKLIYVITGEVTLSLEDTILAAYLNQVGFDVLFFVPTGYQAIEKFLNGSYVEEHQIGCYMYDLQVPDFNDDKIGTTGTRFSWRELLFGKGR